MTSGAPIEIAGLAIGYSGGARARLAVDDFGMNVGAGEFVCLLGPTGCGKSSVLNAIAGFISPLRGTVSVDRAQIHGPGPDRGVVFQQYALFPWMRVIENVEYGLRMNGVSKSARRSRSIELLELVGLASETEAYPSQLSGGMQQRVALARALVNEPRVMLMDEPFGALDAQTRLAMQELLLRVWHERKTTVIFVTHDIDEAVLLADRIFVMTTGPGRLASVVDIPFGRPRRLAEIVEDPQYGHLKGQLLRTLQPTSAA